MIDNIDLYFIEASKANFIPAIDYTSDYNDGIKYLVSRSLIPVIVNRTTFKCLTPQVIDCYQALMVDPIPILFIRVASEEEILISIALNGGLDGFNLSRPSDMPKLFDSLSFAPLELLKAIAPLEYIQEIAELYAGTNTTTNSRRQLLHDESKNNSLAYPVADYGIPLLNPDMQIITPSKFMAWGERARSKQFTGVHFYVDDYRFVSIEKDPSIVRADNIIECNYSMSDQPLALIIHDIFKKRTISVMWQELGMRVAVDLNVPRHLFDMNFMGVPKGWKAYGIRSYAQDIGHLFDAHKAACDHAGDEDIVFLVYGNGIETICADNGWHYIGKPFNGT